MKNRNISSTSFKSLGMLALVTLLTCQAQSHVHAQKIDIKAATSTSQVFQVRSQLEGRGVVIPEDEKSLKLNVDASFRYEERVIARTSQLKSIRSYQEATAKLNIDNKSMLNRLDSRNGIIISQAKAADQPIQIASLGGPITQNEYQLINTPGNTLILPNVFEKNSVKKGDKWKPNKEVLANFLNIDSVDDSDVQIELAGIKGSLLALTIGGDTQGTIDGADTELALNGEIRFNTKSGIVTQARITITQQRDIGLLAPGLDATFKIGMTIQPISTSKNLSNDGLAKLRKNADQITDELLLMPSGTQVSFLHPHSWKVISIQQARTILRYNRNGRMIGQCDIIPLPNRMANQEQTLEQFKAVVKDSLEDSTGQIIGANQSKTENGLDWLRVDAKGSISGVDLQWTYFTINSPDGRRVQLVFTTEPSHARAFAGMEQHLIDTVRFNPIEKTPAQNAGYKKPLTGNGKAAKTSKASK